jgi:hypothetical protein
VLTVSPLAVPAFEALTHGTSPYSGFGPIVSDEETTRNFSRVVSEASARIDEMFGLTPSRDRGGIAALEELVTRIWSEGWDPETADVNLFVRDLGSIFMSTTREIAGGETVSRSRTDVSHASLWWPNRRLEVFPFHKMYRRLIDRDEVPLQRRREVVALQRGEDAVAEARHERAADERLLGRDVSAEVERGPPLPPRGQGRGTSTP